MKKIYLTTLMMFACALSFAQVPKVQGIARPDLQGVSRTSASVIPGLDFDKIKFWAGDVNSDDSEVNKAALVVKWNDGKDGDKALVWGYRWKKEVKATGDSLIRAVATADPQFFIQVLSSQWGSFINGIGYDLNNNGNIQLIYTLTGGIFDTSNIDSNNWTTNDSEDHWGAGWLAGSWNYFVAADVKTAYEMSQTGASGRELTDGCVDGYVFGNYASADMSGDVKYIGYSNPSGITNASAPVKKSATATYTLDGKRVGNTATNGIFIVRSTDGLVKKIAK